MSPVWACPKCENEVLRDPDETSYRCDVCVEDPSKQHEMVPGVAMDAHQVYPVKTTDELKTLLSSGQAQPLRPPGS